MLKKFPSDKINSTRNSLLFLSRAPTHHSFTFKSRFLYELKRKVSFSKTDPFNKMHGLFDFKTS